MPNLNVNMLCLSGEYLGDIFPPGTIVNWSLLEDRNTYVIGVTYFKSEINFDLRGCLNNNNVAIKRTLSIYHSQYEWFLLTTTGSGSPATSQTKRTLSPDCTVTSSGSIVKYGFTEMKKSKTN